MQLVERLQYDGWQIDLIYLALPNIKMSELRVAERVAHGGHNIPLSDIRGRFSRSLHNLFEEFSQRVDRCICFMNDGKNPVVVFEQCGSNRDILHDDYYQLLMKEAKR